MSFDINWELMKDGELAGQLKEWLNERLREYDDRRPAFLGPLAINQLDFGAVAPHVAIQNITNVIDEFYLPDDVDIFTTNPSAANLEKLLEKKATNNTNTNTNTKENINDNASASSSASPQTCHEHNQQQSSHHQQQQQQQQQPTYKKSPSVDDLVANYAAAMRRDTDIQVEILVDYQGDFKLNLSTELIVNQPTPAFITLPLSLTLTGFSFTAVAVISYLGDRVNFCFKQMGENRGLFNDIHIESEIGDKDRQQGVLKNVGKIEKFVLDQIRTLISEHLVYPNYHCLSLISDEEVNPDADDATSEVLRSE